MPGVSVRENSWGRADHESQTMNTDNIVIIGTGQAGGWAAQTLRKEGFAGKVFLIGEEPHRPYERPPLSKAVLSGDALPRAPI